MYVFHFISLNCKKELPMLIQQKLKLFIKILIFIFN
jgi:hypothetical protein